MTAALATLGFAATAGAQEPGEGALLPDLVQEAPAQLGVVVASAPKGTRFRLGFRAAVNNAGAGPLVIESRRPSTDVPTMTSDQVVHHADGTTVVRPGVGIARYHVAPGHRHWHFQRFEVYELRSADGRLVRPSQKTGFCLGDRYLAVRPGPFHRYRALYGGYCGLSLPDLLSVRMGISPGFGDDYDPQLEGQFVDVTGLPAGRYDLVHRVNTEGVLLESDYRNNAACVGVRLRWPRGPRRSPRVSTVPCHTSSTNHTEDS